MQLKLTLRAINALPSVEKDVVLWDTELPGFGLKVTPKGRKIYVFQYKHRGLSRRVTIGRHGIEFTPDQAREKAKDLRGDVARGGDPAGERTAEKAMPTLTEFAERYMRAHATVKKKASSAHEDRRNLDQHILPLLGRIKVTEIVRADLARLHSDMAEIPTTANRCLALLSKLLNLAEKWGLRPDGSNPVRHIDKYPEAKRERFLSAEEVARLGAMLRQEEAHGAHPSLIAGLRLLMLTGARRAEIMTLKWEYIDFEQGIIKFPDSKTGAKVMPAPAPVLELLAGLKPVPGNPYVLPGNLPGQHFNGMDKAWQRLRVKAGLKDVRLHDLRHSFASFGAAFGESLKIIGAVLGHAQASTTDRYAHLSNDPVRAVADRISLRVQAAMEREPGNVVTMRKGQGGEPA
jgi:integrase